MIGPAGFMSAPQANDYSHGEANETMAGMDSVWAQMDAAAPRCHFTKMDFHMAEEGESWWECRHCGHTSNGAQPQPEAKGSK